ncbi:hypothetical protein [Rhizobium sp. Rhizsp42]|uniref:hypothetical protein n=1 Tax=Rhizobium sp. Rhizsp42 TaxID=3243034 RepID=UPI000DDA09DC
MSLEPKLLHKEWGLLPLAMSGLATISVFILTIYYLNQTGTAFVFDNGRHLECERSVASIINAVVVVYRYPGAALTAISLASVIFSYFFDRGMFIFVLICFVIFNYPFLASTFNESNLILSNSSIGTLCERGGFFSVAMQLPIMFLSTYVSVGNIVLLAKRWRRSGS